MTPHIPGWLFAPERELRGSIVSKASVAALFLAGLVGWAYVMGFGRVALDFHDWPGINIPRLMFLQDALRGGEWPLHMSGTESLHGVTDRFLALPDVITSPQSLLLLFMQLETFIVVDVLIHYTLGGACCGAAGWSLWRSCLCSCSAATSRTTHRPLHVGALISDRRCCLPVPGRR